MGGAAQAEQWKNLITRLPGVLGAEFVLEGDAVREVHVLSDLSRGPKQIVRDVQSALLTRFQLELDHRIISVAQIPGALQSRGRRVICDRLELTIGRDCSAAAVCLRVDGDAYIGKATCDLSASGRLRAIALATAEALNQIISSSCRFAVDDVRRVPMGQRQAVLVGLSLHLNGKTEALLGACYEGEDPNFSAALATLDAVNRRLSTLPAASDGEEKPA
ncbi:MAG: hypothetical protein EOM52_03130 [Clostridia bacterium]|nr:hypothetical protein [Clostridia bacterium]